MLNGFSETVAGESSAPSGGSIIGTSSALAQTDSVLPTMTSARNRLNNRFFIYSPPSSIRPAAFLPGPPYYWNRFAAAGLPDSLVIF